jgi:hypothetical protein
MMKQFWFTLIGAVWVLTYVASPVTADLQISDATQECLDCHIEFHPGLVQDWRNSRHARMTPKKALTVDKLKKRMSSTSVPEVLQNRVVGCAECHTLRPGSHSDTFEHNGYDIHVVISPEDCGVCHVTERTQYAKNVMAHAYGNLAENPLYQDLQRNILGKSTLQEDRVHFSPANDLTRSEACYYCHGTRLEVTGWETRDTDVGELEFPIIKGWPNQGVGRVNLDGSLGACSACHTRHHFSIEMARKPYTCKECHTGPDVPAFKVYAASKHGNIFSAMNSSWNFTQVPWTIGTDFSAPTCAVCHISLVVNPDDVVISQRTHQMNDRLEWRIFGLIYAHPQPKEPDTSKIRNKAGLSLPTDFDGGFARDYLISPEEQKRRRQSMQNTCLNCHNTYWVRNYFERLDNTIRTSNATVLTATGLLRRAWKKGYAQGPEQKGSPFDEFIERRWSDAWLFYANNVRFASAMAGGGDYGVFADGRYPLVNTILDMQNWLNTQEIISNMGKE